MPGLSEWDLVYALPNLVLESPQPDEPVADGSGGRWSNGLSLTSPFMAIVAGDDPRVQAVRAAAPAAETLLGAFHDLLGHPVQVSTLIVRRDAPEPTKTLDAIVAFRNAVAFTFLLKARAVAAAGGHPSEPAWSDTFDFHPTAPRSPTRLVTSSDALTAIHSETAPFAAMPSPYVAPAGRRLYPDFFLFRALGKTWRQQFECTPTKSPFRRALFRSLETAYQACSVGAKNQGSLHDYGIQVGLWVSALEILAWPRGKHASLTHVLDLLGDYPWAPRDIGARRHRVKVKGRIRRLNTVQRAYTLLHRARNRFLHGEPVSVHTLLPRHGKATARLPQLAAVVYRTALVAYLLARFPRAWEHDSARQLVGHEIFDSMTYARALRAAFGLRDEDEDDLEDA